MADFVVVETEKNGRVVVDVAGGAVVVVVKVLGSDV